MTWYVLLAGLPPSDSAVATSRTVYTSVCSAISGASSTSVPRYLTVLSSLPWPSRSCTARRFLVLRYEIASAQFAVDRQVKKRWFWSSMIQLQPNPNGPDFFQLQRGF